MTILGVDTFFSDQNLQLHRVTADATKQFSTQLLFAQKSKQSIENCILLLVLDNKS